MLDVSLLQLQAVKVATPFRWQLIEKIDKMGILIFRSNFANWCLNYSTKFSRYC